MKKLTVCITALVILAATSEGYHGKSSRFGKLWERIHIVPDSIDYAPSQFLEVYFPSGEKANLGNELTPTEVKDQPYVSWDADAESLYTLTMFDPDSPSPLRPYWAEFQNWLIVNIPGKNIGQGQILYDFSSSGPPKGTCIHRFAVLVFKQTRRIHTDTFVPKTSIQGRTNMSTRRLIKEFELITKPVAGNFYRAQYDDYVPILYATFGGIPEIEEERSCPKYL